MLMKQGRFFGNHSGMKTLRMVFGAFLLPVLIPESLLHAFCYLGQNEQNEHYAKVGNNKMADQNNSASAANLNCSLRA